MTLDYLVGENSVHCDWLGREVLEWSGVTRNVQYCVSFHCFSPLEMNAVFASDSFSLGFELE